MDLERLQATLTWGRRVVGAVKRIDEAYSIPLSNRFSPGGDRLICASPWTKDLSLTFVGHSILPFLALHDSHLFMDRGAFHSKHDPNFKLALLEGTVIKKVVEENFPREDVHQGRSENVGARPKERY